MSEATEAAVRALMRERLEDVHEPDGPLWQSVTTSMIGAWEALYSDEHTQGGDTVAAGMHIDAAITALMAYKMRLQRIDDIESEEAKAVVSRA